MPVTDQANYRVCKASYEHDRRKALPDTEIQVSALRDFSSVSVGNTKGGSCDGYSADSYTIQKQLEWKTSRPVQRFTKRHYKGGHSILLTSTEGDG